MKIIVNALLWLNNLIIRNACRDVFMIMGKDYFCKV